MKDYACDLVTGLLRVMNHAGCSQGEPGGLDGGLHLTTRNTPPALGSLPGSNPGPSNLFEDINERMAVVIARMEELRRW